MDRRAFIHGLGAMGLVTGCTMPLTTEERGIIYSPAPPATPLHGLNLDLEAALRLDDIDEWLVEPLALPASINETTQLPAPQRRRTLPIVTTADFLLARSGSGPAWHSYDRVSSDLEFCSTLYDIGIGIQITDPDIRNPQDLAGKAIAVPPRPSAVRMICEALFTHGWKVPDVRFVDSTPGSALVMLESKDVAGTGWNPVMPKANTFVPMVPTPAPARFLPVSASAVAAMNEAMGFGLGTTDLGYGSMISFAQGLAAWSDTPGDIIERMLHAIVKHGRSFDGLPNDVRGMRSWPGLEDKHVHAAARKFYGSEIT